MRQPNEQVEINKSKGEKFKAFCACCGADTNHEAAQTVDVDGHETVFLGPHDEEYIQWSNRYQVVMCLGCDTYSFRHWTWFSDDEMCCGPDDSSDGTTVHLYPQRGRDVATAKDYRNVPKNLRSIYKEVISCFNSDSSILCAAGLRATIEGLCAANCVADGPVETKKADGGFETRRKDNLEGRIGGLWEKGILTRQHAEILHEHRFIGNDAVHELSRPSDDDLRIAIDIVEHMFESLYEIPQKAEALRVNRAKKREVGNLPRRPGFPTDSQV